MEHEVAHHAGIGDLLLPAINFVLFAFLLRHYLAGPIREFFRARTERLRDALQAGARAKQEASALRAALLREQQNLPATKEQLRNDLRLTAERERDTLLAQARQAAERIRNDARLLAEYEFTAARQALRAEVIEETVRIATVTLRDGLRPDDQARFVSDFVAGANQVAS